MLEMIYTIPENIGWVIVGVNSTVCAIMTYKLYCLFSEMIQMRIEDAEEDEDEE